MSMNLKEMRTFIEPGFESREVALHFMHWQRESVSKVRDKPCHDCAVTHGLYTGIASCMYKFLTEEEKEIAANSWGCHNGGRCEGAALVLLSKEEPNEIL